MSIFIALKPISEIFRSDPIKSDIFRYIGKLKNGNRYRKSEGQVLIGIGSASEIFHRIGSERNTSHDMNWIKTNYLNDDKTLNYAPMMQYILICHTSRQQIMMLNIIKSIIYVARLIKILTMGPKPDKTNGLEESIENNERKSVKTLKPTAIADRVPYVVFRSDPIRWKISDTNPIPINTCSSDFRYRLPFFGFPIDRKILDLIGSDRKISDIGSKAIKKLFYASLKVAYYTKGSKIILKLIKSNDWSVKFIVV